MVTAINDRRGGRGCVGVGDDISLVCDRRSLADLVPSVDRLYLLPIVLCWNITESLHCPMNNDESIGLLVN